MIQIICKNLLVIGVLSTSEGTLSNEGRFLISHLDSMRLFKTTVTKVTDLRPVCGRLLLIKSMKAVNVINWW